MPINFKTLLPMLVLYILKARDSYSFLKYILYIINGVLNLTRVYGNVKRQTLCQQIFQEGIFVLFLLKISYFVNALSLSAPKLVYISTNILKKGFCSCPSR